jgi:hypothetical protein
MRARACANPSNILLHYFTAACCLLPVHLAGQRVRVLVWICSGCGLLHAAVYCVQRDDIGKSMPVYCGSSMKSPLG